MRFERAYAQSIFTGPSHATLLSGRAPLSTGVQLDHRRLAADVETLAESLARAGYVTAAFPSAHTTIDRASGLPSRFQHANGELREHTEFPPFAIRGVALRPLERFIHGPETWPSYRPAAASTDLAVRFLEVHVATPTFTWVHYFDPHLPYVPPQELRPAAAAKRSGDWHGMRAQERAALVAEPAALAALRALYDAEVAYVDRELGRLVAAAREAAEGKPASRPQIRVGENLARHLAGWQPVTQPSPSR